MSVDDSTAAVSVRRWARGAWPVVLWTVCLVGLCAVGLAPSFSGASCAERAAAIAAPLHTDVAPVARELAPLGTILEVHWVQRVDGGICDLSPGALRLVREGVARVADVAALTRLTAPDAGNPVAPDARLSPWLPSRADWWSGSALDARFDAGADYASAWYWLDGASDVVYFRSDVDHDPAT
ncbi:hypothetical protein [Micromonospora purpureochromogenes]|uniref:Uncharacterized protein n=1 Tax=Micromonospora purpureochromogenes TaxID=47872 RepID=A0ABX2RSY8_9ACTN|nr:hypothetical protein [Micromonospora purpureochromogenes]NYF59657.1 hypothetical protein [Micromonospora purpureochromogenes]